jgi:hypothetical protein
MLIYVGSEQMATGEMRKDLSGYRLMIDRNVYADFIDQVGTAQKISSSLTKARDIRN